MFGSFLVMAQASPFLFSAQGSFGLRRFEAPGPWPHFVLKPPVIAMDTAVGQHQWYHFGVGAPPILVYSWDWDVHWEVGQRSRETLSLGLVSKLSEPEAAGRRCLLGQGFFSSGMLHGSIGLPLGLVEEFNWAIPGLPGIVIHFPKRTLQVGHAGYIGLYSLWTDFIQGW